MRLQEALGNSIQPQENAGASMRPQEARGNPRKFQEPPGGLTRPEEASRAPRPALRRSPLSLAMLLDENCLRVSHMQQSTSPTPAYKRARCVKSIPHGHQATEAHFSNRAFPTNAQTKKKAQKRRCELPSQRRRCELDRARELLLLALSRLRRYACWFQFSWFQMLALCWWSSSATCSVSLMIRRLMTRRPLVSRFVCEKVIVLYSNVTVSLGARQKAVWPLLLSCSAYHRTLGCSRSNGTGRSLVPVTPPPSRA